MINASVFLQDFACESDGPLSEPQPATVFWQKNKVQSAPEEPTDAERKAFDSGLQKGREIARQELEQEFVASKTEAALRYEAKLNEWLCVTETSLRCAVDTRMQQLEDTISDSVAAILVPFLTEQAHKRAMVEFKLLAQKILSDDEFQTVRVHAPERLRARLQDHLEDFGDALQLSGDEQWEVTLQTKESVLQTQIREWVSRIEEAVS